ATPIRLRRAPPTFRMPIELRVGGESAQQVPLDRFDPVGRVDLSLDFAEVAEAVNRQLAVAAPPTCAETEHLANGAFAFERGRPTGTAHEELPEEWELTAGHTRRIRPHGALLGLKAAVPGDPTAISQVVPVTGGCHYRFTLEASATDDDALAEVTWLASG